MINLLKIEWLKLKNYTAFKVIAIFFLVGIVLANVFTYYGYQKISANTPAGDLIGAAFNPYSFTSTWQTTSYVSGFLLILPAMLILMLVTNEYTFRTNRQNVIDGWSRGEFIGVKLVMAFLFALVSTIVVFITAITFAAFTKTSFSFNSVSHVGYFFLKAITYNMFAVLISVLVKKTGFAIGLFFIYLVGENFVSNILDFWSLKLREDKTMDVGSLGNYLPMNAADGLLTFPDNPLKSFAKAISPTDYTLVVLSFAIAYIVLFIWWSRRKYIKADL
jgi:ABC-2 type transport system permease protein